MKQLIVNADDFGLTPGVNAGIVDSHRRGILTSTSLFANAAATEDAMALARRTPTLAIGVHLAFVDGVPTLPPDQVPTLAPDGRFRQSWGSFIVAAIAGRIRLSEIEREAAAQIDRVRIAGFSIAHLDGHKHTHAYPPVFDIVVRVAKRFGINAIRVPCEGRPAALLARSTRSRREFRQAAENLALAPWAAADRRTLARNGLPAAPAFLGRTLTGIFEPDSFHALLRSVPAGCSELMTHPGYVDASLADVRTRLRAEREREVALLTAPETLALVRREGIVLAHAGGLAAFPESHAYVS